MERPVKRFIAAFIVGALLMLGGQIAISLGLYPDQLTRLSLLLQGSLGLGLGCAVTAGGLLGLADTYSLIATRLHHLLEIKEIPQEQHALPVQDTTLLAETNQGFWLGYRQSTRGLLIFLAGLTLLVAGLSSFARYYYMVGLGLGLGVFGSLALALGFIGLRHMRRAHQAVVTSTAVLDEQPNRTPADQDQETINWERYERPYRPRRGKASYKKLS